MMVKSCDEYAWITDSDDGRIFCESSMAVVC